MLDEIDDLENKERNNRISHRYLVEEESKYVPQDSRDYQFARARHQPPMDSSDSEEDVDERQNVRLAYLQVQQVNGASRGSKLKLISKKKQPSKRKLLRANSDRQPKHQL